MHREISSTDRPFQVETPLGLYAFTLLLAGLVGLELWPTAASALEPWLGFRLPDLGTDLSLAGYRFSWAMVAAILGGTRTLVSSAESLLAGRLGADLALAIAIVAALVINQPMVAAEVVLIGLIGECLEAFTFGRTQAALRKLVETTPRMCLVLRDGQEQKVRIEDVLPGERVLVLPGKRVPVDGVIVEGRTAIDQSTLTGESLPVEKGPGDEIFAGTINQQGGLIVEVKRVAGQTVMGRVIELTAQALKTKTSAERTADRWARWFLPIVLGMALLTFLLQWAVLRGTGNGWQQAVFPALAVLVVACPCALILATPATLMAAVARLAKTGVLLKGSQGLERLAEVTTIAFDKTGTLTEGKLQFGDVVPLAHGLTTDELLRRVASAEQRSEHPLGRLFIEEARKKQRHLDEISDFTAQPGGGVRARAGERNWLVGSQRFLAEEGIDLPTEANATLARMDAAGQTAIFATENGHLFGIVGVWDTIRPEAAAVLADLRRSGWTDFLLLTGDRSAPAQAVAERLEITQVHAECLPAQKASLIATQQQAGKRVAMIGDGINDAPALALAHVGLALGGTGADIAAEAGDIVLMGDPLRPLPLLFRLAKKTQEILRQNILWFAIGVNVVGVLLTAWILPFWSPVAREQSPLWAAVYHQLGSLAVLMNAMRLLWFERTASDGTWGRLAHTSRQVDSLLESFSLHELTHWAEDHWQGLAAGAAGVLALLFLWSSITVVPADAVGVLQVCGQPQHSDLQPGLHLHWPWPVGSITLVEPDRVRAVEIGFRTLGATAGPQTWSSPHGGIGGLEREEALMLTGDGNLLEVQLLLQFCIAQPRHYLFGTADPAAILRSLGEAVVREQLARHPFLNVLTAQREEFQQAVATRIRERLLEPGYRPLGIELRSVVFQDVHPPRELVDAYYEVTRAQARKEQLITAAKLRAEQGIAGEQVGLIRNRALLEGRLDEARAVATAERDAFLGLSDALGNGQEAVTRSAARTLYEFRSAIETAEELLAGRPKLLRDPLLKGQLYLWPEGLRLRVPSPGRGQPMFSPPPQSPGVDP